MNYKSEFLFLCAIIFIDYTSSLGNKCMTFIIASLLSYVFHIASHFNHAVNAIHLYHHKQSTLLSHGSQLFLEFAWFLGGFWINYTCSLYLNPWIIIFWYLFYTTVHTINYTLFHVNNVHEKHHELKTKNMGPDLYDIVFDTKCGDIENTDHYIPNILVCTMLTVGIKYVWDLIENKSSYRYAFHCLCVLTGIIYLSMTVLYKS